MRQDRQAPVDSEWGSEKFSEKLEALRSLIYAIAEPILNSHFNREFNRKYPSLTFDGKRKIQSLADFIEYLESFVLTPEVDLHKLRGIVSFVLYGMWGKSNLWAVRGESVVMDFLGFSYKGNQLCNGTSKTRNHRGACVKGALVKKKGISLTRINDCYERCFLERFYARDVFTKELGKLKEMKLISNETKEVPADAFDTFMSAPPKDIDPSKWTEQERSKYKLMFQKASKAKYLVKAKPGTHGFDGHLMYTETHPARFVIDNPCDFPKSHHLPGPDLMAVTPTKDAKQSEAELLEFVTSAIKSGKIKNKRELAEYAKGSALDSASQQLFPDGRKRIKVVVPKNKRQNGTESSVASDLSSTSSHSTDDSDLTGDPEEEEFELVVNIRVFLSLYEVAIIVLTPAFQIRIRPWTTLRTSHLYL
jgi:hypothetical protein